MLYSIGKDSSVMLRLALKAFYPGRPPFPFLHIDTTWKFRGHVRVPRRGWRPSTDCEMLVHVNEEGRAMGINPFTHGSAAYTDVMKTESLKQAIDEVRLRCRVRRRSARRGELSREGAGVLVPLRPAPVGPEEPAARAVAAVQHAQAPGRGIRVFPLSNWTELDVWQYIYMEQIPIVPLYFAAERPVVSATGR